MYLEIIRVPSYVELMEVDINKINENSFLLAR